MARGNPRLLTWDDTSSTVRLFELSETGFVQRASYSISDTSNGARNPRLMFLEDSATIAVANSLSSAGANSSNVFLFDKDLGFKNAITMGTASQVSTGYDQAAWNKRRIVGSNSYPTPKTLVYDTGYNRVGTSAIIAGGYGLMDVAPDDDMLLGGGGSGWNTDIPISLFGITYAGDGTISNYPAMHNRFTSAIQAKFLCGSLFVVTLTNTGIVRLWRRNGNTLTLMQEMSGLSIPPACYLDCSSDGRYFVVQAYSTPRFLVFKRTANSFALIQTVAITGANRESGEHFSEGGDYLISASNKRVWKRGADGLYTELVDFASALPANVRSQGISTHSLGQTTTSKMYAAGLDYLLHHISDLGEVKFALLNASASFNVEATSAAAILANQVTGLGWPSGGVVMANTQLVPGPTGSFMVTCDPVQQIILADITARYGLIYVGDTPLVFVDLLQSTTFVAYSLLNFAADARGLMSLSL